MQGQHTPVDHIAPVPFGGVILGNVGQAPDHPLAAGGLFPGRSVTGPGGVHQRPDFRIGQGGISRQFPDPFQHFRQFRQILPGFPGQFQFLHRLGPSHVLRIPAAQGEFRQSQRVGPVGRSLSGGNQFVRGGHRIQDLGAHLEEYIIPQSGHFRPVLDVGTVEQLLFRFRLPKSVVDPGLVGAVIKVVGRHLPEHIGKFFRRSKDAVVGGSGGDAPGIHQCHGSHLSLARLGPFPVGEVPGVVPDRQAVVARGIPGTEAGSAEGGLHHGPGGHQITQHPFLH